jgi:hypothetical protein
MTTDILPPPEQWGGRRMTLAELARYVRPRGKPGIPLLFFHSWNPNNTVERQGYIWRLRRDGTGKATLFEFGMGEPSDDIVITPLFLECCTFYGSDEQLRAAYARYHRVCDPIIERELERGWARQRAG